MRIIKVSIVCVFMFLLALPMSAMAQGSEYVYFRVDSNDTVYFSRVVQLPYSRDDVTYKAEGQEALRRAIQNFVNAVNSNYNVRVYASSVSAIRKPSHMTPEQFEGERLDHIEKTDNIYNVSVRIL